jgi:RNA polymerase sigma factor (TIGR02999 family)
MAIPWTETAPVLPVVKTAPGATQLLMAWRAGDPSALDRLLPLLYTELARQAHLVLAREREGHTLETRALVHEAYLRLVDAEVDWKDRAHFLALSARTMRRILVDHAKSRLRDKRGGGCVRVTLECAGDLAAPAIDVLAVHQALDRLAAQDERKASLIEMHYFGGLNQEELAEAKQLSLRTVERELRMARAWLRRSLRGEIA